MARLYSLEADGNERIVQAIQGEGSSSAIKELLVGLKQETEEEREQARRIVHLAMCKGMDVYKALLGAVSREVIRPADMETPGVLYHALTSGIKEAVMAVADRVKMEIDLEFGLWPLRGLFETSLLEDKEVVHAVLCVVPPAAFAMREDSFSPLDYALNINNCRRELAVDLCLKHQPPMEEMLEDRQRFWYVLLAAELCDAQMVQRMHDALPALEDGSGRQGEEFDYVVAIQYASMNRRQRSGVWPIFEFLVEKAGGDSILQECDPIALMNVRVIEDVEWLLARSPDLLEAACKQEDCLDALLNCRPTFEFLLQKILELVDREVIVEMMRMNVSTETRRRYAAHGWMWSLEALHRGFPECLDGLRWPWLMQAIEDQAYNDVSYMCEMCSREHFVMRNEDGDTAHDVAVRDKAFPGDLLVRMQVVAKGAFA